MATKKQIKQAIIKTLVYANIFDYPLTLKEIKHWLIAINIPNLRTLTEEIKGIKFIKELNNYYYLKGRRNIVSLRINRQKWASEKSRLAYKGVSYLKLIPSIKLIGISGALALNNTKLNDDIDFFIITSANFLWTTRFLTNLCLDLRMIRRHPHDTQVNNKICLNMFIDENSLSLPQSDRNVFSAHEILQMKPIFVRDNTYQKFIFANTWVKAYLPSAFSSHHFSLQLKTEKKLAANNLLEKVLSYLQLRYMKPHQEREVIKTGFVRFHPKNAKDWVLKKYNEQLQFYLSN